MRRVCRIVRVLPILVSIALGTSAEAETAPGATGAARCPYSFQDGMPPGVFCVYEGVALGPHGEVCADPVLVIWSQLAPALGVYGLHRDASDGDVYFGVASSPDLVVRARADADSESGVTMVDYTFGPHEVPLLLRGRADTRIVGDQEILDLRVRPPLDAGGACAFASYDGAFIGVLTLSPQR